ncbi:MAG: arsenite S-adenosylmethyltransferase [candidate division Zixibacteria bacterium SM23_81]|nr:MAG: arsenite S-adenosylmethyltransferase [candidate division Zixibacteria bacterium SM23_81]
MKNEKEVKKFVQDRYGKIASKKEPCCPTSCCSPEIIEQAKSMGYSEKEICSLPPDVVMGLGCGNPTALAELKEGQTVLDLGCGTGLDAFLASPKVGQRGKVIGVDMTPEMIDRAQENAKQDNYQNVEFRLGEIENLPVEDNSVDIIISNCVINLSPDKLATFKEAFRVLKPQGRMLISDLVTEGKLPEDIRQSFEAWACCIAGALEKKEYLDTIRKAGFRDVTIVAEHKYVEPGLDHRLAGKITSVQVRAHKRQQNR